MRTPLLIALVAGILFAAHAVAQEQSPQPSGGQTSSGSDTTAPPVEVPPAPLLPPGDKSNAPMQPANTGKQSEAPLAPPPPGFTETTLGDAGGPAKPPLNLLDLHGYFRMRWDLKKALDLGLKAREFYPQFPSSATGKYDTLQDANIRFRVEPTINISEDVRIMGQIDILDNLILGSTPSGFPVNAYYPMVAFSQTQDPPIAGYNSIKDSILVKRLWGEVMTPLGLIRFGRVPSQWGLGILANDGGPSFVDHGPLVTQKDPFSPSGNCFDCDYGSSVDRVMFVTKIAGHYIVPMFEWASKGPFFSQLNEMGGQSFDLDQLDDVNAYIIAIAKRDKPEDIKRALEKDDWVFNYGLYFAFRNQAYDAVSYNSKGNVSAGSSQTVTDYAMRSAEAYIPDIWVRFMWKKLRLEMEACMIIGKIGYDTLAPNLDADGHLISNMAGNKINLLQFGGVLQGDYTFMNNQLIIGLELGVASGDDSPYFGVRPFQDQQFGLRSDGTRDDTINNFRFNQDYHVDLILWRQIIGTVTDAIYVKPNVQYNITDGLGAKLSIIYSSAMYRSSTRGKQTPLGVEFNLDFFYFSDDNFHIGISYGLLVPLSGLKDLGDDGLPGGVGPDADKDPSIAHRILGRMVLYF